MSSLTSKNKKTNRKYDENGFWEVERNPISRVGVFFYSGRCISEDLDPNQLYPVFRPPEELSDPECIESFKLLPWSDDHPDRLLGNTPGAIPAEEKGIEGVIGEKVFFDPSEGMLKANIKVFSRRHDNAVSLGKRELSAGYHCKYEYSPGEWNGKPYQFIQRQIRGNHLASVDSGRMGPEVAVMDGFRFTIDSSELKQMKKTNQIRKMMNRLIQFAQDAEENTELEEQEKGEIETLKTLVGQAAPLMDQLAALPTIMAKTQMEEDAAEDEDPDNDLLKKAAEDAYDEDDEEGKEKEGEDEDDPDDDKNKKGGESGMDAKELKKEIGGLRAEIDKLKASIKPAASQTMDAKELMVQISQRDTLAKQLTPFIGTFDAAEMTLADVAKYGCEKLELKPQAGTELAMLSGFLHNRQPAQPLKSFGQDKKESSWLASQTKKGE